MQRTAIDCCVDASEKCEIYGTRLFAASPPWVLEEHFNLVGNYVIPDSSP